MDKVVKDRLAGGTLTLHEILHPEERKSEAKEEDKQSVPVVVLQKQ